MKFVVESVERSSMRAFNVHQIPVIGCEYELKENGDVVGMSARVENIGDEWFWIPESSSLSSYHFKSERMKLGTKKVY